jgi:N-acetylglucosaminyl-diphospho-decaprenol L-rhamnosyltransferase
MVQTDVVIVSYRSRDRLRSAVAPLAGLDDVEVIVVDNASGDDSLGAVEGISGVRTIQLPDNRGFAAGCNAGWRAGSAPYVLFLNPDARIEPASVRALVSALEHDPNLGAAGPKILEADGTLDWSQRRFPRLRSTYAHALFLNRVLRGSPWTSELVQDADDYARPGSPDWVSGACIVVRRSVLEELGGWDEGFFMYCEDKDLCARIRDAGHDIRFSPEAVAVHAGGASAPRTSLMPVLARSRVRYARKHSGALVAAFERAGIALTGLTHALVSRGGWTMRAGHVASARAALRRDPGASASGRQA